MMFKARLYIGPGPHPAVRGPDVTIAFSKHTLRADLAAQALVAMAQQLADIAGDNIRIELKGGRSQSISPTADK